MKYYSSKISKLLMGCYYNLSNQKASQLSLRASEETYTLSREVKKAFTALAVFLSNKGYQLAQVACFIAIILVTAYVIKVIIMQ